MNKKAFTLIELLAVVVVIGLLAVIIIPKVQSTLTDSKKKTYEASVHALVREANNFYMTDNFKKKTFTECTYNFTTNSNTCTGFEFTGEKPESGSLSINKDGEVAFGLKYDNYCYSKSFNNETIVIAEAENCGAPRNIGEIVTISGENFYVIESNTEETKLLAMYNINVGTRKNTSLPEYKQHESLTAQTSSSGSATVEINSSSYSTLGVQNSCPEDDGASYLKPKYGTTYPTYFYDEDSNQYNYLESYKALLTNVKEIKLPSYEDITNLGCNEINCNNAYPWVYSTKYWLGTAASYNTVFAVSENKIEEADVVHVCQGNPEQDGTGIYGIRPVIIVNTEDI